MVQFDASYYLKLMRISLTEFSNIHEDYSNMQYTPHASMLKNKLLYHTFSFTQLVYALHEYLEKSSTSSVRKKAKRLFSTGKTHIVYRFANNWKHEKFTLRQHFSTNGADWWITLKPAVEAKFANADEPIETTFTECYSEIHQFCKANALLK